MWLFASPNTLLVNYRAQVFPLPLTLFFLCIGQTMCYALYARFGMRDFNWKHRRSQLEEVAGSYTLGGMVIMLYLLTSGLILSVNDTSTAHQYSIVGYGEKTTSIGKVSTLLLKGSLVSPACSLTLSDWMDDAKLAIVFPKQSKMLAVQSQGICYTEPSSLAITMFVGFQWIWYGGCVGLSYLVLEYFSMTVVYFWLVNQEARAKRPPESVA